MNTNLQLMESNTKNQEPMETQITKPKLFTVLWKDKKGNFKYFYTNDENTALNKKVRTEGQTYIDTRYAARLRLYHWQFRKANNLN